LFASKRHEVGGGRVNRKPFHVAAEALRDQPRGLQHRLHRGMIFGRDQDRFHRVIGSVFRNSIPVGVIARGRFKPPASLRQIA
jgi:hypothetical protein